MQAWQEVEEFNAKPEDQTSPSGGRMSNFTTETLEAAVADLVADLTGQRPAVDQPLAAQGLDSLAAMELRQKLQACQAALVSCDYAPTVPQASCQRWCAELAVCPAEADRLGGLACWDHVQLFWQVVRAHISHCSCCAGADRCGAVRPHRGP